MELKQLWALAEKLGDAPDRSTLAAFGRVGLFLDRELTHLDYVQTPINSLTFATTGGDGVHFSFLQLEGVATESGPVVMTVPCSFDCFSNTIVGEDLHEFLCLGCHFGYFELEQLVYDEEETLARLANPEPPNEWQDFQLSSLRKEFNLEPWKDVPKRLTELNRKYLPLVQHTAEFIEYYEEELLQRLSKLQEG